MLRVGLTFLAPPPELRPGGSWTTMRPSSLARPISVLGRKRTWLGGRGGVRVGGRGGVGVKVGVWLGLELGLRSWLRLGLEF